MNDTIDRIRRQRTVNSRDAWASYMQLVRAIAANQEIDHLDAAVLLDAVNRSDAQLRQDVQTVKERIELRKQLAKGPEAASRLKEIDVSLQRHDAAFRAVQHKHNETVGPLIEERNRLQGTQDSARHAERRLRSTVIDESLQHRRETLNASRKTVGDELRRITFDLTPGHHNTPAANLRSAVSTVADLTQQVEELTGDNNKARLEAARSELAIAVKHRNEKQSLVDRLKERKAVLDASLAEIEAAEADLNAEELLP